ncbi:MAG: DUF2971 domain-containing protein [Sedimentisphaerales bacterium]|nr:DUF2971 domain-containing protein [Sedimentisphaerales bacterium]
MRMKLYKYKSLQKFEHVADIICNKQFYAAQYYELNDPMEGLYNCEPGTKKEYLDDIKEGKKRLRICSFSKDPQNPLLWAHYADGFKGICIEVEIDEDSAEFDIAEVEYSPIRIRFSNRAARLTEWLPKLILRQKAKDWSVEQEVRLLTSNQFVQYGIKITGILLGLRTPDILKNTIIRLAAPGVKIWDTKIASRTNRIVIGGQANHAKELFP